VYSIRRLRKLKLDTSLENIRIGYQVAVNLWGIDNQAHWARFSSMLVANSIIIGVIGLILTSKGKNVLYENPYLLLAFVSSIGGLLVCIWYFLMEKDFADIQYYTNCAKLLEIQLGIDTVNGYDVDKQLFRSKRQNLSTKRLIKLIVAIFGFIYSASFVYSLSHISDVQAMAALCTHLILILWSD
jgi:hypothetical protein